MIRQLRFFALFIAIITDRFLLERFVRETTIATRFLLFHDFYKLFVQRSRFDLQIFRFTTLDDDFSAVWK